MRVLVTRPSPYGEKLCAQLLAHGYQAVFLPLITIRPWVTSLTKSYLVQLNTYNWVIFVSQFAVTYAIPLIQQFWPILPQNVRFAAVGAKTADALLHLGYQNIVYPAQWSSSALLALPELHDLNAQKIAVFCGLNSNQSLFLHLSAKGAKVTLFPVYQSYLPPIDITPWNEMLANNLINVIVCTCVQSVYNLQKVFTSAALKSIPLLVSSKRIMAKAQEQGFAHCVLIADADWHSMLSGLAIINKGLGTVC